MLNPVSLMITRSLYIVDSGNVSKKICNTLGVNIFTFIWKSELLVISWQNNDILIKNTYVYTGFKLHYQQCGEVLRLNIGYLLKYVKKSKKADFLFAEF